MPALSAPHSAIRRSSTPTRTLLLSFTLTVAECYSSIFSFGDSLVDAGNSLLLASKSDHPPNYAFPPYGETYFRHPTGRCSDGRLIVDFIAQYFGLPLLPPYLKVRNGSDGNLENGVNFAVVGATALDVSYFEERGIRDILTNCSLAVQLRWFKEILPSLCLNSSDCNQILSGALFIVGEFGGNDYSYALIIGDREDAIQEFVPPVVDAITSAVNELIELGARTIMVPGCLPFGCSAAFLTRFMSSRKEEYDAATGCINWLNEFTEYHSEYLLTELNKIQQLHPYVRIMFADFYHASMDLYRSPKEYRFTKGAITACCGGGDPYNYNASAECGY